MSRDRGRARAAKTNSRRALQLAPGVRLDGERGAKGAMTLIRGEGRVHLNETAVTILELCDGSRNRDRIVRHLMRDSQRSELAGEVRDFLDAAQAQGWIVETQE
jgi:coenzyme PQQ biosynthesis protein PqqD